jgi:hypothetical protein
MYLGMITGGTKKKDKSILNRRCGKKELKALTVRILETDKRWKFRIGVWKFETSMGQGVYSLEASKKEVSGASKETL